MLPKRDENGEPVEALPFHVRRYLNPGSKGTTYESPEVEKVLQTARLNLARGST